MTRMLIKQHDNEPSTKIKNYTKFRIELVKIIHQVLNKKGYRLKMNKSYRRKLMTTFIKPKLYKVLTTTVYILRRGSAEVERKSKGRNNNKRDSYDKIQPNTINQVGMLQPN